MSQETSGGHKLAGYFNGGAITFAAPQSVTVGSTSTAIVAANPNRKYLALCNISDETMYLAFGNTAEQTKGMPVYTAGTLEWMGPYVFTAAVNGICASGSKTICYIEGY